MSQNNEKNASERLEWSPPVLEQLTVDLDAIANNSSSGGDDGPGNSTQLS